MTIQQELSAISKALLTMRRDFLRTLARTKALEAMMREALPESKRAAWHKRLDKQTKFILQSLLETFEKQNPGYAALLDDRQDWEVSDDD